SLNVFVPVATEHSFSRAAIKLCRTQPAVSQAVRRLEEDLGEVLFDRSTKSVKLTHAGDALLPDAIRLLRMADETVATVRQLSQQDRAVLRIGGDKTHPPTLPPSLSPFPLPQPQGPRADGHERRRLGGKRLRDGPPRARLLGEA